MLYYGVNRGVNVVSVKGIGKIQLALTEGLINVFNRLGNPDSDIKSPTFWLMMDNILQVWSKVFPLELAEFKDTVRFQKETESITRSEISGIKQRYAMPANLFRMTKTFFPYLSITNKDFINNFLSRYPFFKTTEK